MKYDRKARALIASSASIRMLKPTPSGCRLGELMAQQRAADKLSP
jgi:hypothetical protein